MELSILNFVIGHNRKIPSGLTETHEDDIPERAMKGLSGGMQKITSLMRFLHYGKICQLVTLMKLF